MTSLKTSLNKTRVYMLNNRPNTKTNNNVNDHIFITDIWKSIGKNIQNYQSWITWRNKENFGMLYAQGVTYHQ